MSEQSNMVVKRAAERMRRDVAGLVRDMIRGLPSDRSTTPTPGAEPAASSSVADALLDYLNACVLLAYIFTA